MKARARDRRRAYALAAAAVAVAAATRWALDPFVGDRLPYGIFLLAVAVAALVGRLSAGLGALAVSAIAANYLFVAPRWALSAGENPSGVSVLAFLAIGTVVALMADYVGRTREGLREATAAQARQDREVGAERARLQAIIDSIPGVVWEAWGQPDSSKQQINYVSDHVHAMLGYSPEEWTSQPNFWLHCVLEEDRERAARKAAETFASGQAGENEFRWLTKDGRVLWVMARSSVIKDASGRPVGMRGVTFDITDRKEVEQRLALLAEISTTGLVTPSFQDLARDIARRTAFVVGDYCIIRMLREHKLQGVAYAHVSPDAEPLIRRLTEQPDLAARSPLYAEMVRNPRTFVDNAVPETVFAHIDRTDLAAEFERFRARRGIICPLTSHGELLGTLSLGRAAGPPYTAADVRLVEAIASQATLALDNAALFETAQREAAEAQVARTVAEEAGRVKDEFLATLSHELRTPLNAILGWAHMLRDPALAAARRQAAVETIVRNAQAQEQLISDILDVQRIMAGKIRLNLGHVDLGATIRAAAETVQPSAAVKNIRLQLLVDLDVPTVWGDPDRMQQVVWNLLSNAIKFAPAGGHVQVRLLKDEAACELVVEDDGPGIDAGVHAAHVRALSPGGLVHHPHAQGARPGARDRPQSRRAARRDDCRGERAAEPRHRRHRHHPAAAAGRAHARSDGRRRLAARRSGRVAGEHPGAGRPARSGRRRRCGCTRADRGDSRAVGRTGHARRLRRRGLRRGHPPASRRHRQRHRDAGRGRLQLHSPHSRPRTRGGR